MKKALKKIVLVLIIAALAISTTAAFAACNKDNAPAELRLAVPDGAPALAVASFLNETKTVAGYKINAEIVAENLIATEMAAAKADIIILPTNAGANLILKDADYKLVTSNIMGLLYIIGPDDELEISDLKGKTLASIGQKNTPEYVLKTVLEHYGLEVVDDGSDGGAEAVTVKYLANGAAVKAALDADQADYGLLGEPAATAFSTLYPGRIDLQEEWKTATGASNSYPQASMFVKSSLLSNADFAQDLFSELEKNLDFIEDNKASMTDILKSEGSSTTFPPASIARCNIGVVWASDIFDEINDFLKLIIGKELPETAVYPLP
ncbi:MAG TPA: hypothetical protein P5058_04940 [Eubacteriales bacterium]|nr:hypothetical protein [Eubacteriales bacterium]